MACYGIALLFYFTFTCVVQVLSELINPGSSLAYINNKNKLSGLSLRANYTDRRLSAKLVPTFADRGCHVVSVADPYARILGFLTGAATFSSSSSIVLTRLSGPRSRPTTQKIW
jgi:hypothetical protein